MKRKIITFLIIVVCFILESTVFRYLALASITPNLMIIVTSSFGFMRGKKSGMLVGFISGLLIDIMFGDIIGFYALIYMLIGYGNGFFQQLFYEDDIKLPLVLICASEFVYGIVIYVFLFLFSTRSRFDFLYYLWNIIVPELIYTIIVTIGLYQIILHINRKLEVEEKRSASKFV